MIADGYILVVKDDRHYVAKSSIGDPLI